MSFWLRIIFFLMPVLPGSGAEPAKTAAQRLELTAIDGRKIAPLDAEGKLGVVLFFVSPYCPTSNNFGPEMNAIGAEFANAFAFRLIHSEQQIPETVVIQHAAQMEFTAPVLRDEEQKLALLTGVRITPEAVVLNAQGETLYQGRINDWYLGPTRRQREVKTHDLREALTAIREGRKVTVPRTEAMGCSLGVP